MAVVINDFEVVSEPPSKGPATSTSEEKPPATSEVQKAQELNRLLTHHRERMERVRAH